MDASTSLTDVAQRLSQLETTVITRFDHLERQLGPGYAGKPNAAPVSPSPPMPSQRAHYQRPQPATPPTQYRPPQRTAPPLEGPGRTFDFAAAVERVMKWAGLVLVSFAAIFLVSTAITRGWIGPELQLFGATAIGFSLYGVSTVVAPKRHHWSSTLNQGATAITIACAVAAHEWLGLVSTQTGIGLVAAAATISGVMAIRLKTPMTVMTAGVSAILASLVMQIAIHVSPLTELIWLTATAAASLLITLLPITSAIPDDHSDNGGNFSTRWRLQRIIVTWSAAAAMLFTGIQSSISNLVTGDAGTAVSIVTCFAVTASILWLGPSLHRWLPFAPQLDDAAFPPDETRAAPGSSSAIVRFAIGADHRMVIGLPLWLWLCIGASFDSLTFGDLVIVGAVIGATFILAAALSRRHLPKSLMVAHLFGAGAILSVASIAALDGSAFLAAMTTQAVGIALVGRQLRDRLLQTNAHGLVLIAAVAMTSTIFGSFGQPLDAGTTLVYFTVGAAAFVVAKINKLLLPTLTLELYYLVAWLLTLLPMLTIGATYLNGNELTLLGSSATAVSFLLGRHTGRATSIFGVLLGSVTTLATTVGILDSWITAASTQTYVAHLSVILLLAAASYLTRGSDNPVVKPSLLTLTWFLAMAWLVSVFVHLPQGQLLLSAAWATAAAGAILVGVVYGERVFQLLGMITLTAVLLKLFTTDLRTIDTFWRAGLFFVLGVGFLRLGYQLPKLGSGARTAAGR